MASPPHELVMDVEARLIEMFPGASSNDIRGTARATAGVFVRKGLDKELKPLPAAPPAEENIFVREERIEVVATNTADDGCGGANSREDEDDDDVVIGEVENAPTTDDATAPAPEPRRRPRSPFPSRRPIPTPAKSNHSSPPSRRPIATPVKSPPSPSSTTSTNEFPDDFSSSSIPDRMPVSTPATSSTSRPPATPCELKYVNNTWTLTPMKANAPQLFPDTPLSAAAAASASVSTSTATPPIQMTWKCYTLDHPMSATLPLANDSSEDVTFHLSSSSTSFKVSATSITVPPNSSVEASVTFNAPPLEATVRATLKIQSTLVEEPQIVQLKGTVVNEPLLQVDKRIIAWTREGGGSKLLKLRNSGNDKFKIKAEIAGGDEGVFKIVEKPNKFLRPGKETFIRVECNPDIIGDSESTLVLSVFPSTSSSTLVEPYVLEDVVHFLEPKIYDVTLSKCGGNLLSPLPPPPPPELEEKVQGVGDLWDDYVGRKVMKPFEDTLFEGIVVQHREGGLWRVRYSDGDEEDMELPELVAAMDLYKRGGIVPYIGVEEGLRKLMDSEGDNDNDDENHEEEEHDPAPSPKNDTAITFEPSTSLLTAAETPRKEVNTTLSTPTTQKSSTSGRDGRVYLRRSVVEFGEKTVGTCGSMRLQLCNSTSKEVVVRVSEPSCPFVVLHKKIRLKPKAFVRLPVRFVPVSKGLWESMLHCDVGDGRSEIVCLLRGMGK